jgi:hypothetical protein
LRTPERYLMKKTFILFMLTVFCIPMSLFAGPLGPDDFSYCADVQGTVTAEKLYQVHLSDEFIQKTKAGFEDLRLFDTSGKETPLIVIGNVPPHEMVETYPLEITGYDSDASSANVIMKLPQKHRAVSVLYLDIVDRDFKKRVTLSGSNDGKTWQPIIETSVFDFSSQVNVRKTKIEFASTDVRYFRIKLSDFISPASAQPSIKLTYEGLDFSVNNAQKKDLRIRSAKANTLTPVKKRPVYDRKIFNNLAPAQDKQGNTVIILPADLPLDTLSIEVVNPYFHRFVNLYGSSTGKDDSYRLLATQVIYRFPLSAEQHEERNVIEQHIPKQAFYKIVIINKNNPPLELKNITLAWVQQNLFFIALRSEERYSLCMGNTRIKRPDYDIGDFVNQNTLSQHTYERMQLAPLRSKGSPRITFGERLAGMEKLILKIVVVLLVLGMGFWLYMLLKKTPEKK